MNLDTQLLRSFVCVVDAGSFAEAAARLHLTPSAISGQIKRLETATGKRLLERTTRSQRLTGDGELLYGYARTIVGLEQEALARLNGGAPAGRVRIGATEDFAGTWLPRLLREFRRQHPETVIELRVGLTVELLRQMERKRLDLVFGKGCASADAAGELLWEEQLVWAFASEAHLDKAASVPLAAFPDHCVYRTAAAEALGAARRAWHIVMESSSMAGCLGAAACGLAVTVVAQSQLREGLRALGAAEGMPKLPGVRFYAFSRSADGAALAIVQAVRNASRRRFAAVVTG